MQIWSGKMENNASLQLWDSAEANAKNINKK